MFVRHQVVLKDKSKYVKIELYLLSSTIHYVKKKQAVQSYKLAGLSRLMKSRLGEAASRHKGIDICDLHGQGLVMVNRHNLTQLSSIDYHRFIFEAQGPKPVNRIFLGRKTKQWPQHVPGGYEVGHFWTFFGVATLSPHVMFAGKTCFRSC
jgi:hypothetical protein